MLRKFFATDNDFSLLILRLGLGIVILPHGLQTTLGLIFGALTRLGALGIGMVMAGAISMVHWQNGFFMNWSGKQAGEGFEYHLLAITIALVLLLRGGGALSIDRLLGKG